MSDYDDDYDDDVDETFQSPTESDGDGHNGKNTHRSGEDVTGSFDSQEPDGIGPEDSSDVEGKNEEEEQDSLEKGVVKGKKQPGNLLPPEKLLKKAKKKAIRYCELKKPDRAIRELIQCTALVQLIHGERHWKLGESHVKLATSYLDLKGYIAQAVYHVEIAENILRNHPQPSPHDAESERFYSMFVELYHTLGRAYLNETKLSEAEAALSKAEKMFLKLSKVLSISHDDIEDWHSRLALTLARLALKQKKFAVATMYFERSIKLLVSQKGEDCIELINIYQSLGKVEQSKGEHADHTKAIEFYLKAHSIASARYSESSVEVADSSLALAQAYTKANDHYADNSAERYFGDSLAIYQAKFGPAHEKTLAIQDDLARLFIRTERIEEGVELLQSTLPAKQDRFGDFSPEVAETWKLIGSCYLSTGVVDRALRAMKKCLAVEAAVYGEKSRRTKATKQTVDMLLANPAIPSKLKKSNADKLQQRPRFSSTSKSATQLGGFKPQMAFF